MKSAALRMGLTAAVLVPVAVYAQVRPGNPTTSTVITKAEIDKILATEEGQRTRDENARVVDIGDGWSMELGVIHRAKQNVMTVGEARAAAAASGEAPAAAGRGNSPATATSALWSTGPQSSGGRASGRHHARLPDRRLLHHLGQRHRVHRWQAPQRPAEHQQS